MFFFALIWDLACTFAPRLAWMLAGDSVLAEYDTLVVNSGAHVLEGGMSAYESRMSMAAATLTESMTRLHGDDAILVVRNTSPGHWNCEPL